MFVFVGGSVTWCGRQIASIYILRQQLQRAKVSDDNSQLVVSVLNAVRGRKMGKTERMGFTVRGHVFADPNMFIVSQVQIQVANYVYTFLAIELNKWENHRTETEYEDSLIVKVCADTIPSQLNHRVHDVVTSIVCRYLHFNLSTRLDHFST